MEIKKKKKNDMVQLSWNENALTMNNQLTRDSKETDYKSMLLKTYFHLDRSMDHIHF